MARRKTKFCTACEMNFMGNHVCTALHKKVLYDDPCMVSPTKAIAKEVAKGPDSELPWEDDNNNNNGNTGTV